MKHSILLVLFVLFIVFMVWIVFTQIRKKTEKFTPYINSRFRPFVRYSKQQWNQYPFPNFNRIFKKWGLI